MIQNLGLGVLEQKPEGQESDSEDDMTDGDEGERRDVMSRLMGDERAHDKGVQIQEVGDG